MKAGWLISTLFSNIAFLRECIFIVLARDEANHKIIMKLMICLNVAGLSHHGLMTNAVSP